MYEAENRKAITKEELSSLKFGKRGNTAQTPLIPAANRSTTETGRLKGDELVYDRRRMPGRTRTPFVALEKPGQPQSSSVQARKLEPHRITADEAALLEPLDPKSDAWRKSVDPFKLKAAMITAPKSELRKMEVTHSRPKYNAFRANSKNETSGCTNLNEYLKSLSLDVTSETEDDEKLKIPGLVPTLLPHQRVGVIFMMKREQSKHKKGKQENGHSNISLSSRLDPKQVRGGFLCDDMGLGKTVQALALVLAMPQKHDGKPRCTLVVVPLSILWQWYEEANTKAPKLKVKVHHRSATNKLSTKDIENLDLLITTYDTVRTEHSTRGLTTSVAWYRVICDEGHVLRSFKSKLFEAIMGLQYKRSWILTGTPVNNSASDLFSYFCFLRLLPRNSESQWKEIARGKNLEYLESVRTALQALTLRRRQTILGTLLPGCTRSRLDVEFSEHEADFYEGVRRRTLIELGQGPLVLTTFLRLRQTCSDYRTLDSLYQAHQAVANPKATPEAKLEPIVIPSSAPGDTEDGNDDLILDLTQGLESIALSKDNSIDRSKWGAKLKAFAELMEREPKRKTVVFSSFVKTLQIFASSLKQLGFGLRLYDGSMSATERTAALADFTTQDDCVVLLCSLKASAVGLNITAASRVVIVDPWFNPTITDQAVNRVYRLGQKSHVEVFEMCVKHTVEERIFELQAKKRKLAETLLEEEVPKSDLLFTLESLAY